MKLIKAYDTQIKLWSRVINISVEKIQPDTILEGISRVYVIAADHRWNLAIIYNSKRCVRWFPWWHHENNESIVDTATREYIVEVRYELFWCVPVYVLKNEIDSQTIENQVICFWKIWKQNTSMVEPNESVTEIWFFPIKDIIGKIGNGNLRQNIIQDFRSFAEKPSSVNN